MSWKTGNTELNGSILIVDGSEVTTGTVSIEYFLDVAGTVNYLATGLASLTTTPTTHVVTHTAGLGWLHRLTVPSVLEGYTVHWVLAHSTYGDIASESHYVTAADMDDVAALNAPGASVSTS